jgi:N-acetylglucosamine-6-phosphate deacetylase
VALVTDAMAGAGVPDGPYSLGSLEVVVRDGEVRGPNGVLAGSVLTMIDAVRNLHALGVELADAVGAATSVPAAVLGLPTLGRLDVGLPADLVVLNDGLEIESVFVGGEARVVA